MSRVIDVRDGGGELVVLGKALILPSSNTDGVDAPLDGSVRFNDLTNTVQVYASAAWSDLRSSAARQTYAFCITGQPASSLIYNLIIGQNITFPNNLVGSFIKSAVNATATYDVTINRNGSLAGHMILASDGTSTMTTASGSGIVCLAGDLLSFVMPTSDATLATLSITVVGTNT